jgi:hypothetical protein
MAEIGVFLEGLSAQGLRAFWGEQDGWRVWVALYKPEDEQETKGADLVVSTTFSDGVFTEKRVDA